MLAKEAIMLCSEQEQKVAANLPQTLEMRIESGKLEQEADRYRILTEFRSASSQAFEQKRTKASVPLQK